MPTPVAGTNYHFTLAAGGATYGFLARSAANRLYQAQRADDFAPRISVGTDPALREGIWDAWAQSGASEGIDQLTVRNLNKILSTDGNVWLENDGKISLQAAWNSSDASKTATAPMLVDFPGGTNYTAAGIGTKVRRYNHGAGTWTDSATTLGASCVWLHKHGSYMYAACSTGADLYRSSDLDTWTQPAAGEKANCFTTWEYDNTVYLVKALGSAIERNTDDGVTWGSSVSVGNPATDITGLAVAFGLLVIGKTDGIYTYDGVSVTAVWEFPNLIYSSNCRALVYHDGFLYTNVLADVVRMSFSGGGVTNRNTVTPPMFGDENTELYDHGVPVWIWASPKYLYVAFDDGQSLYPEVLYHNGQGWHQAYKGASGDTMYAGSYSRLGNRTFINDGATRFRRHTTYRDGPYPDYPATGTFTTSDFDGGLPFMYKAFREIAIEVENVTVGAGQVAVEYSLDKGANFTALGTVVEAGKTYLQFPGGEAVASQNLRLRFTITRNSSSSTPRLRRFACWVLNRPTPIYVYHLDLVVSDDQTLVDDSPETVSVDERLSFLLGAEASKTQCEFVDFQSRTRQVYITKASRQHLLITPESTTEEIWIGVDMIDVQSTGKWDEVYWNAFLWA